MIILVPAFPTIRSDVQERCISSRSSMASTNDDSFPSELSDRLTAFDESLTEIDTVLQSLHDLPLSTIHEKSVALDKARLDILGAYAMNSLFWMYLNAKGENPKEHGVKQELDRVRRYMDRVKEVQDKIEADKNRPRINKDASKRFVRSALWQAAQNKANQDGADAPETSSQAPNDGNSPQQMSPQKRPQESQGESKKKKKKKKDKQS